MPRNRLSIALAALALLGARAAAAAHHQPTLADVNRKLEDRPVSITLESGDVLEDITGVVVGPEETFYRPSPVSERRLSLPTREIVTIRARKHVFRDSVYGGLAIGAGVGVGAMAGYSTCNGEMFCVSENDVAKAAVATTLIGGAIGAIVGSARHPAELTLYEGPVDRYANATSPAEEQGERALAEHLLDLARPESAHP